MNVLERTIVVRWRNEAYQCWAQANGDAELAEQLFRVRKPHRMGDVPWSLILTLVIELLKLWARQSPQAVMSEDEAAFLGLESD